MPCGQKVPSELLVQVLRRGHGLGNLRPQKLPVAIGQPMLAALPVDFPMSLIPKFHERSAG
jgi:hypothetical protein